MGGMPSSVRKEGKRMNCTKHRVVVTGLGVVTPIGNDCATFWRHLRAGLSGVGPITQFDTANQSVHFAAEVKDFDLGAAEGIQGKLSKKEIRRTDRFVQFALAAAEEARCDAGLLVEKADPTQVGVMVGSGIGGLITLERNHEIMLQRGPRRVSAHMIPMMIGNMSSGRVSMLLNARGPSVSLISACSTGVHNIGCAFQALQNGDAKVIFAGGTEATICPLAFAGFSSMGALSKRNDSPTEASCPFSQERDGFVMGEGAGILVLETLEHAEQRGVGRIYAEVVGYGTTSDAYHSTQPAPHGEGAVRCMQRALESAGLQNEDVDYINAHGTSTELNDLVETQAIRRLFGRHADRLKVSANKSMVGHLLGAAGGVEAVATVLTLHEQVIPPTINYRVPDPECDLDYVPNQAIGTKVDVALSNSFGFGGHNATLVLRRFR
ncbi:beta-ketoacyl-ACP synthase II [Pasteuria penetrans]|nr:beta-ketoacyl-ACP synthase II [Pasteuria penetrans]